MSEQRKKLLEAVQLLTNSFFKGYISLEIINEVCETLLDVAEDME